MYDIPAINCHCLAVQVLISSHKENRSSRILVFTWRPCSNLLILFLLNRTLVVLSTLPCCHLTWEHARSDVVDLDLQSIMGNLGREKFCEVIAAALDALYPKGC